MKHTVCSKSLIKVKKQGVWERDTPGVPESDCDQHGMELSAYFNLLSSPLQAMSGYTGLSRRSLVRL